MFGGKYTFLLIISTLIMIKNIEPCLATDELPIHQGVNYVGIGYNIIEGNPEGGDLSTGGVDPGLLVSRRIFKFTFDEEKTTSDLTKRIPDEVVLVPRQSAFTTKKLSTFYGTESYASKLSAQVEVSGGYEGATASVQFAASARYERVASKTSTEGSVFLSNETITNLGHARYQSELALTGKYFLSNGFVADVCRLPATYTDATKDEYMQFMDDWGTHVVFEVALGMKEGENLEEKRSSFVNYASQNVEGSISAEGAYAGFSASLSVNMESFDSAMDSGTSFGSSYSQYRIGSETLNEPISVKLIAMPEIFEPKFWTGLEDYITAGHCTSSFDMSIVKQNMDTALRGFGEWHDLANSTNPDIRIPLTWPEGVYGLPEPINGCPTDDWDEGHRVQMREAGGFNSASNENIFAGWLWGAYLRQDFCMKTVSATPGSKWQWQPGSYCIYQYDSQCPQGFTSGNIHWSDGNEFPDYSRNYGVVPAGTYGIDTEINFCCRNDGVTSRAIYLPTDHSFILLARFEKCQLVHGMSVKKEWIFWDTPPNSEQAEVHPGNGLYNGGVRLVYCYYHVGDIEYPPNTQDMHMMQMGDDIFTVLNTFCDDHPGECNN